MTRPQDHPDRAGPRLFLRGGTGAGVEVAMLLVRPEGAEPGPLTVGDSLVAPTRIAATPGRVAWRYDVHLPAGEAVSYSVDGETYAVRTRLEGDLRIAYTSCDGKEEGDWDRPLDERNALWSRLRDQHRDRPFALLLQGGDQIYADEVTQAHPLTADWPEVDRGPLPEGTAAEVRAALDAAFWDRYLAQLSHPATATLAAEVPALAMWDDHDICDGWGSLPEGLLDSERGRLLFAAARAAFLVFQFGCAPDEVPPICPDRTGTSLGAAVDLPGLTLVAPDLRSERRRGRVMGPEGWAAFRRMMEGARGERVLLMSSVPALGPRLSLVESVMGLTPRMEKYEDDLRDQWQSRTHRAEWRDLLRAVLHTHARAPVTVLSGEIHLATHGVMQARPSPVHQLVASGITHPAPPLGYAMTLGLLARLGEAPLAGHPIRIRPLPGRFKIYCAQRNFLTLERTGGAWSARWELERSGATPPLAL